MTSEKAPESHKDAASNRMINQAVTDLEQIICHHDPEIDCEINGAVWDRLDRLCADAAQAMVAVKPLEWETSWAWGLDLWHAAGYEISVGSEQGWHVKGGGLTPHAPKDLDSAKATAQADYEKRILSALQSPADAQAALTERERLAWNSAIEAAEAVIDSGPELYGGDDANCTDAVAASIAALKRERSE